MEVKGHDIVYLIHIALSTIIVLVIAIALLITSSNGVLINDNSEESKYEQYQECVQRDYDKEFCAVRWAK